MSGAADSRRLKTASMQKRTKYSQQKQKLCLYDPWNTPPPPLFLFLHVHHMFLFVCLIILYWKLDILDNLLWQSRMLIFPLGLPFDFVACLIFSTCWLYSPLLFASLLFKAICKACSDSHFVFLHFFFLGMVLIPVFCTMSQTSIHSSSGTLSDLVP